MIYVVLAMLFGSVLQPLTILLSLPLSIAGYPGGDWHAHADGHRLEECDHAGRFCD